MPKRRPLPQSSRRNFLKGASLLGAAAAVTPPVAAESDLKAGAHVFIPRWEKQADGTWDATVVVVGRDGMTPPM